jgi:glycosyltransferase involved in cell wall biosynthesis
MKISIITVCYNSAATIVDTLASVASQRWPDIEHIIIDGASKDGTQEIIKRHGTHVAKYISEPDQGIYDAMNKGIAIASGDIIALLNADDSYAHPDVLSHVAQHFTDSIDAVFGDVAFFRPENPTRIIRRFDSSRFSPKKIAWGWMPAHPGLFLRREVYQRAGLFKTDYRIAGDYEFVARAFSKFPLAYTHIPEILVNMRIGGASTSGLRGTIRLNREVLRACRENGISTNWCKILSKYPTKILEFIRR